jgi:hypothetical protein
VIPSHSADGLLPSGRHAATVSEIEQRFVSTFPTSVTRRALLDGWRRQTEELLTLIDIESEWINGSFVTTKRDPRDIDMAVFVRVESWNALDNPTRQRVVSLTQGPEPKLRFGCDSYPIFIVPDGDPLESTYLYWRGYWDRQWSRDRLGAPKGYVEVRELR